MNKFFIVISFFCIPFLHAQDLMSMLDDKASLNQPINSVFKDSRVVNAQSTKQSSKGEFKFLVQHRFGTLNSGFYNLWGLDNSMVRMGLDYGISDRLMLSIGRSSATKQYDASIKAKIVQQTNQFPLIISFYSAAFIKHPSKSDMKEDDYDFLNQMSFANQLIIARKFSSNLSLILLPTHIHKNRVEFGQPSDPLFLGFGGRYKITKKVSVNGEYFYPLTEMTENYNKLLSLGFDVETGGHVFSLHLSNSRGMTEHTFLSETNGDWLNGDIYFGFNISRVFAW